MKHQFHSTLDAEFLLLNYWKMCWMLHVIHMKFNRNILI